MNISTKIVNASGEILAATEGNSEIVLVYRQAYVEGDRIVIEANAPCYLAVWLDAALPPAPLYFKGGCYDFEVPFGERKKAYAPQAFAGELNRIAIRQMRPEEIAPRRNLAFNPCDNHANTTLFPHAYANVETRGESVFAARNAIDGEKAANDHGRWPFTSWGINRNSEATLTVDFGRPVEIDEAVFYQRADFPHDAWWESASLTFSDGETMKFMLEKMDGAQAFTFTPRRVEWIRLHTLIKADDPSPFPALTQLEFWGYEA